MKDKLVSMAPFFVIILMVVIWGYTQGWFVLDEPRGVKPTAVTTEAPVPSDAAETGETAAEPASPPLPVAPASPVVAPEAVEADHVATQWSTYHGDTRLAGVTAAAIPDTPTRLWRFQTNAAILYGPVASESMLHFVTSQGEVVAVDFMGKKIWSKQLTRTSVNDEVEQPARVDGPVSCYDNTLLLGTMAGTVYALDAVSGDEKWRQDIGSAILGAVTYHKPDDGPARVYVIGQDDGALHCLAFADGAPQWKSEAIDRCDGSPAAGDGIITFGSCASALHVVSADDGTILKNISVGDDSQIAGGVALLGDTVFSGSHSGQVFRLDIESGEVVWMNEDSLSEVFSTPAVSGNTVVVGSMDDFVYALDRATGKQLWKFDTQGLPLSPVIAGNRVIVSSDGVLYMLSLTDGARIWSFEVSDEITAPSIINDMIVVGGKDGSLSAFGAAKS